MKNKKIIALAIIALGIFLIIFFVLSKGAAYNISPVVAKNVDQPYIKNGEVYFFTGHGFAKYSLSSQKTTALSDFMNFPKILDVSISEKNAVFKTSEIFSTSDLYYYLQDHKLPVDRFYWWATDFSTGKTSLVAEKEGFSNEIVSVKQYGDGLLVARRPDSYALDAKFELYKQSGTGGLQLLKKVDGEILEQIVWADSEKAIFSSKKNGEKRVKLSQINFNTLDIEPLPEDVGGSGVSVSPDGQVIAFQVSTPGDISEEKGPEPGLYLYRIGDDKAKMVLKAFVGSIKTTGDVFLISGTEGDKKISAILSAGGKVDKFSVKGDAPGVLLLSGEDQDLDRLLATDGSKNLFVLSKNKEQFSQPPAVPQEAFELTRPGYNIKYFDFSDSFSVLITKNPYEQSVKLALKHLNEIGVDTNQHTIFIGPANTLAPDR